MKTKKQIKPETKIRQLGKLVKEQKEDIQKLLKQVNEKSYLIDKLGVEIQSKSKICSEKDEEIKLLNNNVAMLHGKISHANDTISCLLERIESLVKSQR